MVDLAFNNFTTDKRYRAEFFKNIAQKVIEGLGGAEKNIELSVNLIGEGRIKALNKKYLGKNRTTDVLSFPVSDEIGIGPINDGIMALGDIFICLPMAKKDALKEGVSLSSKLALLAVHGLLHLLGYDHEKSEKNKKEMFKLQNKILKNYKL